MIDYTLENGLQLIRLNYGRKATLEKCKEELQELIQALNKNDFENVHEEVADVYNILSHIKAYYNITDNEIIIDIYDDLCNTDLVKEID